MKINKFNFLITLIAFLGVFISKAQDLSYPLKSADGSVFYGSYVIDNHGNFVVGKRGTLTFAFASTDVRVDFYKEGFESTGNAIRWTPSEAVTQNINVRLLKISDNTIVDSSVPITLPVKVNTPPKCTFGLCEATFSKVPSQALSINVKDYVNDEENDDLTFAWISNPNNFPAINSDGILVIPSATLPGGAGGEKVGVLGIRDSGSRGSISFVVRVNFHQIQGPPKFIPNPDRDKKIYLEQIFSQGDPIIPFAIKALDPSNNAELPVNISGNTFGINYGNGFLSGNFSYGIIDNNLNEDQLGTIFTKEIMLTSGNNGDLSDCLIVFKIKWKAGPEQYGRYNQKRAAVDSVVDIYRAEAIDKWNLIYADLRRVKRGQDVIEAIGGGLTGLGGLQVFAATTPVGQIIGGLAVVQAQAASMLRNREQRILTNINTLISALGETGTAAEEFLLHYRETPSRPGLLIDNNLNTMEDKKRAIENNLNIYRGRIASIVRVTRD